MQKKQGVWRSAGLPVIVIRLFVIICELFSTFEASLVLNVGPAVGVALRVTDKVQEVFPVLRNSEFEYNGGYLP